MESASFERTASIAMLSSCDAPLNFWKRVEHPGRSPWKLQDTLNLHLGLELVFSGFSGRLQQPIPVAKSGIRVVPGAAQAAVQSAVAKFWKGAVQGAAQAAVHSARPLHCKGFCWARSSIVHCEFLEGSTFKRDRDEISSGRKSVCPWFDLTFFSFGNNILAAVWTAATT